MEPRQADAPRRRRSFGFLRSTRERRDPVRLREEEVREPPVERLQPWSIVALAQGAYYALVGTWPLVHRRSFEKVTGPKLEEWLSKGVGACWLNVGLHLMQAGLRGGRPRRDERGLAVRTAATFAALDLFYAGLRRRISPVYLVDGIIQLGFIAFWSAASLAEKRASRRPPIAAHA